ncbi:MAG: M20/M25/M40 family metallo-hydrolase [Planctomycetota bacterium]
MTSPIDALLDWIALPSITGAEADYAAALADRLEAAGFAVERQEVAPGRFNVLARAGEPRVVFCTHLDTVPPWFGPSRRGGAIHGRGACDAKGPAVAMLEAARRLLAAREERIGLLFTVGEEVDSAGARRANEALAPPWRPRYTIVGEPTANRFVRGGKGVFRGTLHARGVAGHSALAGGPSAIHALVGAIQRLLAEEWGHDDVFGRGTINIGEIAGGVAANVVAPRATASVMVRAVEGPAAVEARIRRHLGEHVELVAPVGYGPIRFALPAGDEGPVVAFGTDAPFLPAWGTPLLYGPGRIEDAHTVEEKIAVESLEQAIADYEAAARTLLARIDAGAA